MVRLGLIFTICSSRLQFAPNLQTYLPYFTFDPYLQFAPHFYNLNLFPPNFNNLLLTFTICSSLLQFAPHFIIISFTVLGGDNSNAYVTYSRSASCMVPYGPVWSRFSTNDRTSIKRHETGQITENSISEPSPPAYSRTHVNQQPPHYYICIFGELRNKIY